jgi:hypothetical protein
MFPSAAVEHLCPHVRTAHFDGKNNSGRSPLRAFHVQLHGSIFIQIFQDYCYEGGEERSSTSGFERPPQESTDTCLLDTCMSQRMAAPLRERGYNKCWAFIVIGRAENPLNFHNLGRAGKNTFGLCGKASKEQV